MNGKGPTTNEGKGGKDGQNVGIGVDNNHSDITESTETTIERLESKIDLIQQLVQSLMTSANAKFNVYEQGSSTSNVKYPEMPSLTDGEHMEPTLRLPFTSREPSWPPKSEELLVISGLNPDKALDDQEVRYLFQSLDAWENEETFMDWHNIYDLIELLRRLQQFKASPYYVSCFLEMLRKMRRILDRIIDANRSDMPNDRGTMEVIEGIQNSISETIHYWRTSRFQDRSTCCNDDAPLPAFNPHVPPPSMIEREEEYIKGSLSSDKQTSLRSARSLLKDIAQMSTIQGGLESDREFCTLWLEGFEVNKTNASMMTMKEAKKYFTDTKFDGDPIEYMDFVADYVGSAHNNRLLSVQEKANVLRFACTETVRKRCGLVHATTLTKYKEMIECLYKRHGSNLEHEDAYTRKLQMIDPIKLHDTKGIDELVGILRQFRMVSGLDHSKLIMNSAKKTSPRRTQHIVWNKNTFCCPTDCQRSRRVPSRCSENKRRS